MKVRGVELQLYNNRDDIPHSKIGFSVSNFSASGEEVKFTSCLANSISLLPILL